MESDREEYSSEEEEYDFEGFEQYVKHIRRDRCVNISQDFETITTLSSQPEIRANKKIQEIKTILDALIINFPFQETNEIHSIYNHNPVCLQSRKKFLIEYDLIIYFLEYKGISFPNNILSVVFPCMLIKPKKKSTQKNRAKIRENFSFGKFEKDKDEIINELYLNLKRYASGLFFYIKLQLKKNKNDDTLIKILFKDINCSFVNDPRLQIHISYVTILMMRIILLNQYNIYFTDIGINKTKTFEYQASLALRVIMRWIVEDTGISKLFLNYKSPPICKSMIENSDFKKIIETILDYYKKEPTLKRFISSCLEKASIFLRKNNIIF